MAKGQQLLMILIYFLLFTVYYSVIYYTIGTQKCTITPIYQYKFAAMLYTLRPGLTSSCNRLPAMLFSWKMDQIILYRINGDKVGDTSLFIIDVQPQLISNNFNDEKEWIMYVIRWLQSSEENGHAQVIQNEITSIYCSKKSCADLREEPEGPRPPFSGEFYKRFIKNTLKWNAQMPFY